MKKDNLTSFQFACLIGSPIFSLFNGLGSHNLIHIAKVDAWISVLISFLLGMIPLAIFLYLFNYKKDLNILEKNKYLFGPFLGTIMNILINIFIFFIGIVQLFNISNFAISQFLAETPILLLMILLGIILVYNVSHGIKNISRVAIIFISIIIILTIISTAGLLPTVDLSNIKPTLEKGITPPLKGGIILTLTNVTPIFMLLIIAKGKINDDKNLNKYFLFFYALAFLFAFLAVFLAISSLGIYLCEIYQYPEYTVLKKISLFNFIERIENFIYIKWILNSFITISLVIYHISNSIKENSKILVPSLVTILLIIISNYLFKTNTVFYYIGLNIFPYLTLSLLILYLTTFINILIRKIFLTSITQKR